MQDSFYTSVKEQSEDIKYRGGELLPDSSRWFDQNSRHFYEQIYKQVNSGIINYHTNGNLIPPNHSQKHPKSTSDSEFFADINNKRCYPIPSNLIEKLAKFGEYKLGWNGYQGRNIEHGLIDLAMDFLFYIFNKREGKNKSFQTSVFPLSSGGVQIEIDYLQRSIEIAFEKSETQYLKIQKTEKGEEYEEGRYQKTKFEDIFKWLFARP